MHACHLHLLVEAIEGREADDGPGDQERVAEDALERRSDHREWVGGRAEREVANDGGHAPVGRDASQEEGEQERHREDEDGEDHLAKEREAAKGAGVHESPTCDRGGGQVPPGVAMHKVNY